MSLTPPVLAGQMKSSDKEVASAQEAMVQNFTAAQEAAAEGKALVQAKADAGEDLELHVYHNYLPSCHYVFKDGSQATFVAGIYKTANPNEIEQLDKEVRLRHPHIYIKKDVPSIVSAKADADPMAALREKIRAEILAESAPVQMGNNRVMDGNSLKPASTADVAVATAGGVNGGASNELPASLKAALNKSAGA